MIFKDKFSPFLFQCAFVQNESIEKELADIVSDSNDMQLAQQKVESDFRQMNKTQLARDEVQF